MKSRPICDAMIQSSQPPAQQVPQPVPAAGREWLRVCGSSPIESEHQRQAYRFSVAPWRLLEMLWPNVFGRTFPQNHAG